MGRVVGCRCCLFSIRSLWGGAFRLMDAVPIYSWFWVIWVFLSLVTAEPWHTVTSISLCLQLEGLGELCSSPVANRTVFLDFNVWRALEVSIPSLWGGPGCAQHRTLWAPLELQDQQLSSPAGPGRTDGIRNHTSKVGGCFWNTKPMFWPWNLHYQTLLENVTSANQRKVASQQFLG